MKIDSPTFLTETTFISSSVVFSSGSQKIGNTDDDQHIVIGNFSGSAKTTGSFGAVKVKGSPLITGDSDSVIIGDYGLTNTNLLIRGSSYSTTAGIRLERGSSGNNFLLTNDGDFNLERDGIGDLMKVSYTGTFSFPQANTKISGSSTSTGSFGAVTIGKATADNQRALTVVGNAQFDNNAQIYFKRSSGTADPYISYDSSDNFNIFNPVAGEIRFAVGSGYIFDIESTGINFNGSKSLTTSSGAGVITVNGNSGVILKSGTGGGSGPIQFMHGTAVVGEVTTAGFTTGDSNNYYFLNPGQYDGAHTAGLGWNKLQLGNNGANNIVAGHHSSDSNAYLDFYTDNTTHPTGSIDGKHVMRMDASANVNIYSGSLILTGNDSGNISGSSTSTGSFGELNIDSDTATLKITGNQLNNSSAGPFQSEIVNGATATYQQKMTDGGYGTRLDGSTIIQFANGASTTIRQAGGSGGTRNMTIDATEGSLILQTESTEVVRVDASQRTFIGDQHSLNFSQDNATGTNLQIATSTNSTHQFGQTYHNLRSEAARISLGRHAGTSTNRYHMHQDSGSGAGTPLGRYAFTAYSMGGGGPTWHNAADITSEFEDNPSTNTAPGNLIFRTMESYSADATNPRERMRIHGGSRAGDVSIYSGSLILTGNDSGNISGSVTSTGSFGMIITPSDVSGKPAARLHQFAFLRASDHEDNSTSAYNSKSGNTIFGYDAGSQIVQSNGAGHSNTYIGHYAGHSNASGTHNTLIGHVAGLGGSGDDNVAIGSYSGYNFATGDANILVGQSSGFNMRSGSNNVAIGDNALYASRGASQNTIIGSFAGYSVTTGTGVVGIGYKAGYANKTQGSWIAIGYEAMGGTAGTNEAAGQAIGYRAMFNTMDGANGTALGGSALENLVGQYTIGIGGESGRYASGSYNTFLGYSAGRGGTTSAPFSSGTYNTAIGYQALYSHTDGANKNTTVGRRAGYGITTGDYNVLLGNDAGFGITTGGSNVVIGHQAMDASSTAADGMVAIGVEALGAFNGGNVDSSVAVGEYSLNSLTDGVSSVAVGTKALRYTTGNRNTAVGSDAAYNMTTGDDNVAVGYLALGIAGAASDNTAVGNKAGRLAVKTQFGTFLGMQAGEYATGSYNTFVGGQAGQGGTTSAPYSSGQYNTAVGYQALTAFTTGEQNVAIGRQAGIAITSGDDNIVIGKSVATNLTTGTNNIAIGEDALDLENTGTYQIAIGYRAGYKNRLSDTSYNTFIGNSAGRENTSGNDNTYIGNGAGYGVDAGHGDNNTAVGKYAIFNILGNNTTAIGNEAGYYASGSSNTFVGSEAGKGGTTSAPYSSGENNTAVGANALDAFTTGHSNNAFGKAALGQVTTGQYNIGIGNSAGGAITTGQANVAISQDALASNQGTNDMIAIGFQAMYLSNHADTAGNVAIGYTALRMNVEGAQNVAIGDEAGRYATGSKNTFVGHRAGLGSTSSPYASGDENTAIGNDAFRFGETAKRNVAIGHRAGELIKTGDNNTYIGGYRTGYYNQAGDSNIGIGNSAIGADANTYVNELVAVGVAAGALTAGNVGDTDGNVYVGYNAGYSNVSGSGLTFLGYKAGQNATGSNNTYLGYHAGQGTGGASATTGDDNTGIGYEALKAITSGEANVAIGRNAGLALTSGDRNVIIGKQAGAAMTIGTNNVVLGVSAMSAADGLERETIAIGYYAGGGVNSDSAIRNVFIGESAGYGGTGALNYSVAIGYEALKSTDTNGLSGTVAIGYQAGKDVTSGTNNVFMGYLAGSSTTSGYSNTFIGFEAGNDNTTGYENTFIGQKAGHHGDVTTQQSAQNTYVGSFAGENIDDGSSNTAIGRSAMRGADADGNYALVNTAVGVGALSSITDGQYNTCLGGNAGDTIGNGAYNIMIGVATDVSAQNANYQYVMGHNIVATAQNQFTFGKASNIVQNEFDTDAAWTRTSDVRKKRNIKNDILGLDFINKLKPVTFQWKPSNEFPKEWNEYSEENNMDLDTTMHGMIAQDVKQALDDVGVDTFGGWKEREDGSQVISREMFVTPLIKAVQELTEKNEKLENKIKDLEIFIIDKLGDK